MKNFNRFGSIVFTSLLGFGILISGCTEKMARHESQQTLEQMIEQAQTKEDHEAVAAKYDEEARSLLEKAKRHEKLAFTYKQSDNPKMKMGRDAVRHCQSIAQKLRDAATENTALAKMHREMAQ